MAVGVRGYADIYLCQINEAIDGIAETEMKIPARSNVSIEKGSRLHANILTPHHDFIGAEVHSEFPGVENIISRLKSCDNLFTFRIQIHDGEFGDRPIHISKWSLFCFNLILI